MRQGFWERIQASKSFDDIADLDLATDERFDDGWLFLGNLHREVASVYLFGYAIELSLKCSIFELQGIAPGQDAYGALASRTSSQFARSVKIHDLLSLAEIVCQSRQSVGKSDLGLEDEIRTKADLASVEWSEQLRYRPRPAHSSEADALQMAELAQWFIINRRRMVS